MGGDGGYYTMPGTKYVVIPNIQRLSFSLHFTRNDKWHEESPVVVVVGSKSGMFRDESSCR
jgi:hypothetical protein